MNFKLTISEKTKLSEDRRKHKRSMAVEGAFAVIRSGPSGLGQIETMSRGEIAIAVFKSKPIRMGQIINISRSGLSFRYFPNEEQPDQPGKMDILFVGMSFYVENLPFKTILEVDVDNEYSYSSQNRKLLRVQFGELDSHQISQLDFFIQNCTLDRRSGQDRRQFNDPEYAGPQRRNEIERRKSLQWS